MNKILIVDDSEAMRTQLRKELEAEKYTVIEAYDGIDGLKQLSANKDLSLIISDVNMPNMDGFTMCGKIRENKEYANITILMLTTEATPEMKLKGREVGVRAWVAKPYVFEKLILAINRLCNPTGPTK